MCAQQGVLRDRITRPKLTKPPDVQRPWIIALLVSLSALVAVDLIRLRHLDSVTALAGVDAAPPGAPRSIPTGTAHLREGRGVLESDTGRRLAGPIGAVLIVTLATLAVARWSRLAAALVAVALGGLTGFLRALLPGELLTDWSAPRWEWRIPFSNGKALSPSESELLVERHLAYWLAARSGRAGIVLAPPTLSAAIEHFGQMGVVGTWDDEKGFGALLTIAGVPTLVGCEEVMQARHIRYIVIPTWDRFFENFTRYLPASYAGRRGALLPALVALPPPVWLRPLAYQSPVGGAYDSQAVLVYEVVPDQTPALAVSRDVEYEIEMGRLNRAALAAANLSRYPGDVGALAARAQLALAQENAPAFGAALADIDERLATHADRFLPWDRRVSLAVVLAQGDRSAAARTQTERCLTDANSERIRSLSAGSLSALIQVAKMLAVDFPTAALREEAVGLLPPGLRVP